MKNRKKIKLHTIIVEKDDGTPLVTLGRMTRDPVVLAGFLIALKNLSEEISELDKEAVSPETTFTFHNFGKYFVLLLSQKGILSSLIIDTLDVEELDKIGNLLKLLNRIYNDFSDKIWNKLDEAQKMANLIPQDFYDDFSSTIIKTIISKDWYDKVTFSDYFILSETGIIAIRILYEQLIKRLIGAFGPKLSKILIEKLASNFGEFYKNGNLKITKEGKKLKVSIIIPTNDESAMQNALEYLANIYVETLRRIKYVFHKNALEQLNVITITR